MINKAIEFGFNSSLIAMIFIMITVSSGFAEQPICVDVDPSFISYGYNETITITGINTNWIDGVTSVQFSCDDVTINNVLVLSPIEISVDITTPECPNDNSSDKQCDVYIDTGYEYAECSFELIGLSLLIDDDGDGYPSYMWCVDSKDYLQDCDDNNSSINPDAEENCCNDIDDDCDNATDWEDSDCSDDPPCNGCLIFSITPDRINTGFGILPRFVKMTIEGVGFNSTSKASFGSEDIRVLSTKESNLGVNESIAVFIMVWGADKGTYSVYVDNCSGGSVVIQ